MPNMDFKAKEVTKEATKEAMYAALRRILVSLSRMLLKQGVSYGEFVELAKRSYVEVAAREYGIRGRPANKSRIAMLTGLSRKEVSRLQDDPLESGDALEQRHNRNTRIVSGWLHDPAFLDQDRQPAVLPLTGAEPSFDALVRRYSGDIPPKAVLRELTRLGVVDLLEGDEIRLAQRGYVPGLGSSEAVAIFGSDTSALIDTIDHNLSTENPADRIFQRKVSFPALSETGVQRLRQLSVVEGQALLEKLDQLLADYDASMDSCSDAGSRESRYFAGLGVYMFRIRQPRDS